MVSSACAVAARPMVAAAVAIESAAIIVVFILSLHFFRHAPPGWCRHCGKYRPPALLPIPTTARRIIAHRSHAPIPANRENNLCTKTACPRQDSPGSKLGRFPRSLVPCFRGHLPHRGVSTVPCRMGTVLEIGPHLRYLYRPSELRRRAPQESAKNPSRRPPQPLRDRPLQPTLGEEGTRE